MLIEDKRKLKEDLDKANEKIKAQDKERAGMSILYFSEEFVNVYQGFSKSEIS